MTAQATYGVVMDLWRLAKNIAGLSHTPGGLRVAELCTTLRVQFAGHDLDALVQVAARRVHANECSMRVLV